MRDPNTTAESRVGSWPLPRTSVSASVGAVVVLVFVVAHGLFITDIWFNAGPMIVGGALSGLAIAWSYRSGVRRHSTAAWLGYAGLLSVEMIALGIVSLVALEPRFTMAELLVRDDAIDVLLPPALPLMVVAMFVGTVGFWLMSNRRIGAIVPLLVAQVLLVLFLGHQFAVLGLVEQTTRLVVGFLEFTLITVGLAAAFSGGVMWATITAARRG
jgi:hypothetical protein